MIHNALEPELAWPTAVLMAAKKMLKFGYQSSQGLGTVGHGSIALIELPNNKGGFNLGYEPSHEECFQASRGKKRKCIGQGMSIPHIRATFLAPTKVIMPKPAQELQDWESDLVCIIWLCPEEFSMNVIISPKDNPTSAIRLGMPGEASGLWITRKGWNSISSLFACLCYFFLYLYSLFISPVFFFPRNNKKEHFPFIIIKHELCFPPTHNPLTKLSSVLFRKFLHLSLFAFLGICVC